MLEYQDLKKIIFKFGPETAHNIVGFLLKNMGKFCPYLLSRYADKNFVCDKRLTQKIFDVDFLNPVGIGAGFDKNGTMIRALNALGFGYIEFGTVTPKAQSGNTKPRLFRFPEQNSIQNAMGFNNDGMYEVQKKIKKLYPYSIPLGANMGKNKTTSEKEALGDYDALIRGFKDMADYLVINISSPNTPGLRDLQNEEFIKALFELGASITDKPILLKIAPDLEVKEALDLCDIAVKSGAKGIIATNTTMDYALLENAKDFGGLSGEVLQEKSFILFDEIAKKFYGKTTLISVGGIDSAEEAYKRIRAGASLVQVYSALIFKGPNLIKEINEGILGLMDKDGFHHISEAVGADR